MNGSKGYFLPNWLLMVIACTFSILLFRVLYFQMAHKNSLFTTIGVVEGIIWLLLIYSLKRLKHFRTYLLWSAISMFNAFMWLVLDKSYLTLSGANGEAETLVPLFFIPLVVLVIYQVCRVISLKVYEEELYLDSCHGYIPELDRMQNLLEWFCFGWIFSVPQIIGLWNNFAKRPLGVRRVRISGPSYTIKSWPSFLPSGVVVSFMSLIPKISKFKELKIMVDVLVYTAYFYVLAANL